MVEKHDETARRMTQVWSQRCFGLTGHASVVHRVANRHSRHVTEASALDATLDEGRDEALSIHVSEEKNQLR